MQQAAAFVMTADLVLSDDTDAATPGVAGALAVLEVIAASDAACCTKLGVVAAVPRRGSIAAIAAAGSSLPDTRAAASSLPPPTIVAEYPKSRPNEAVKMVVDLPFRYAEAAEPSTSAVASVARFYPAY